MNGGHVYPGATTPRLNRAVLWCVRRGLGLWGVQELTVRGRTTGEPRRAPVNPLTLEGRTLLVAPRGHVQWTRNLRAAGEAGLRLGRRERRYAASELPDREKPEVLRAYYARWGSQVARYFAADGVTDHSTDEEWLAVAAHYPVFVLTERR